jgi:hypothetical protein
MSRAWLVLPFLLACGDDRGGANPDAAPGPRGLCDDRPCLTRIASEADWLAVSEANRDENRCDVVREGKYLLPAREGVALDRAVFQDVKEHRFHVEFMRTVLGEYFPGLTPARYAELVQRRATREYYAGAIYELRHELGHHAGWGFDVIVDPSDPSEQLSEAEIWDLVLELNNQHFPLGINYAPRDPQAIEAARGFTGMVHAVLPRTNCAETRCADDDRYCLEIPAAHTLCGHFAEGRSPELEHAMKIQLELAAGDHRLPRVGAMDLTLFTGGTLGQARTPLTPLGAGRFEIHVDEWQGEEQIYTQRFSDGTTEYVLWWRLQLSPFASRVVVDDAWLSFYFWASLHEDVVDAPYETVRTLGSCAASGLERWEAVAELAGGDAIRIEHRYQPPFAGSGPLFPVRAEVTLGGESFVVDDYHDHLNARAHHNWNNQFWVVFDEPRTYHGHDVYGLWIDEPDYTCCPLDGV